jgi:hypothetical protein
VYLNVLPIDTDDDDDTDDTLGENVLFFDKQMMF